MQNLEDLEKFGQPGRIAFREDETAPVAVLVAPGGSAEVSLYGANVLAYRPTGHSPVLWLGDGHLAAANPGSSTRGGIPVCWPWFGQSGDSSKPMHGFARNLFWSVVGAECDASTTSVTLAAVDSADTMALWPHAFRVELRVAVGPKLSLKLTTFNTGRSPFDITEALHAYFRVGDVADVLVTGFDGQPYHDKAAGWIDSVQSGAIAFANKVDRVYFRHSGTAVITDSKVGRRIAIEKKGSGASVVWNPNARTCATIGDMRPDDWRRFVCVETANAGTEPIRVEPGARHSISAEISAILVDGEGRPVGVSAG
ncbi:MAG: D-hexose-6-phosphate mutarotase [Kiritimatiellae bacterium]|nr:D-hexose-6-phosphate mutarotase [Kiritimatiellia bacterium]